MSPSSQRLRGRGSTVTWRPSIPSRPLGKKRQHRVWEKLNNPFHRTSSWKIATFRFSHFMVSCYLLVSFFSFSEVAYSFLALIIIGLGLGGPQELGAPVHWTAWSPGFYATVTEWGCHRRAVLEAWSGRWSRCCPDGRTETLAHHSRRHRRRQWTPAAAGRGKKLPRSADR